MLGRSIKIKTLVKKIKYYLCYNFSKFFSEDDFVSENDLFIACLILQKQIEHIDGKKENIVIPSIKMKQIREQNGEYFFRIFIILTFLFCRSTYA